MKNNQNFSNNLVIQIMYEKYSIYFKMLTQILKKWLIQKCRTINKGGLFIEKII